MNEDWDKIEVEEIEDLIKKVEEFYAERGSPKLNALILSNLFLKRLKNDLDYYVSIEGIRGYGKSNLMLLLSLLQARYSGVWENTLTGKKVKVLPRSKPLPPVWKHIEFGFKFNNNMSFLDDSNDVKKKYFSLDKYMPFAIDEGSKNLHRQKWQDSLSFMLVKLSDVARYQNKVFFICFPHFAELNSIFRNDRIMLRLYVYHRNVDKHFAGCIMSLKDTNRYVMDSWHTDENAREYEQILKRTPPALRNHNHILKAEKKLKGFAGDFEFPELKIIAPRIWDIYLKYKTMHAEKDIADKEGEETESTRILRWKIASRNLIDWVRQQFPKMTYSELAKIMQVATITISQLRTIKPPDKIVMREAEKIIRQY